MQNAQNEKLVCQCCLQCNVRLRIHRTLRSTTRNLFELNQCRSWLCLFSSASSTPISFPCLSPKRPPVTAARNETMHSNHLGKKKKKKKKRRARNIAAVTRYHAGCLCVWVWVLLCSFIFAQRCFVSSCQSDTLIHFSLPKLHNPKLIMKSRVWGNAQVACRGGHHPTPVFDPFTQTFSNLSK